MVEIEKQVRVLPPDDHRHDMEPMHQVDDVKFLRLRRGPRYCLALLVESEGILPSPFWSVEQALLAIAYRGDYPPPFETEVFDAMPHVPMPSGFSLFVRSNRKRSIQGAVVWGPEGLFPAVFPTVRDAQAAASPSPSIVPPASLGTEARRFGDQVCSVSMSSPLTR